MTDQITIDRELFAELVSNCRASIAEAGISDARRVYRDDLHFRALACLEQGAAGKMWRPPVQAKPLEFTQFGNPESVRNFCSRCGKRNGGMDHIHTCTPPADIQGHPV